MPVSPADLDPQWLQALRAAARELPHDDRLAQIFYEQREDLRIDMTPQDPPEVVRTELRGLRVRRAGGGRAAFLSSPDPGDASRLVHGVPRLTDRAGPGEPLGAADDAELGRILDLFEDLRTAAARSGPAALTVRWVSFLQRAYVAGPGLEVLTDLRSGARIRIEVRLCSRGGVDGVAVRERVFRFPRDEIRPEGEIELLVRRARERFGCRAAPGGETMVVFAPAVGGILVHELVGHALEADVVLRRASGLSLGETVAPRHVTVVDDPRRGRGAWRRDDEGVESRATPLIEAGRVAGMLHDRSTASRAGTAPTGHGRRSSFREPVRPRMGCTFLAPGPLGPDEIVAATPSGIYVRRMEAASTDTRSGTARFLVTDADRIDHGRPGPPLRPFLLQVRRATALASLDGVGNDVEFDACVGSCLRDGQPLAMSVGAPTCRIGLATVVP